MPKKSTPNHITIHIAEDVVSFFTHSKRNHFDSESKLYDSLVTNINGINPNYLVHLTTYPYIAVHVSFGLADGLNKDKVKIEQVIHQVLESHLKQT